MTEILGSFIGGVIAAIIGFITGWLAKGKWKK